MKDGYEYADNETHQEFLRALRASVGPVQKMARWLGASGYGCRVPSLTEAPSHDQWRDHSDDGDIRMDCRIEVKHLSTNFTCADDWPWRRFFICSCHAWDQAKVKPFVFFQLNRRQTHCSAVFPLLSRSRWYRHEVRCRNGHGVEQKWCCSVDDVTFFGVPKV